MLFRSCVCVCVCVFTQSCLTLCDPQTVACQPPLSMEFSRREYWSGLPFPSPGDLPNPGVEPGSPALQVDTLPSKPSGKPKEALQNSKRNSITTTIPNLPTLIIIFRLNFIFNFVYLIQNYLLMEFLFTDTYLYTNKITKSYK